MSPRLLNRFNNLSHVEDRIFQLEARRAQLASIVLRERFANLFAVNSGSEFRIFSQNGEDGILLSLLQETGAPLKTFVEIGIENARECNTAMLAFVLGWDGLMLEADTLNVVAAQRFAARMLAGCPNRLRVEQAFVTRENVNQLVGDGELGVLSIDVDGMDYWLWRAVENARPRVVIIEYNASFGPNDSVTVPYQPDFSFTQAHPSAYYYGASLSALEKLGLQKGYALVAVDAAGVNAFFINNSVRPKSLLARSATELFRPHLMRTRLHSPEKQWTLIRHLPLEWI